MKAIAKRVGSPYRSGGRSADWQKWRANRGQELVIGGYIPNGDAVDSILVGYYAACELMYAASVRAGIPPELRRALLRYFAALRTAICPVANLPDGGQGRRGERSHRREDARVPVA